MLFRKVFYPSLFVLLITTLVGCAGTYKLYEGNKKPTEIAVITSSYNEQTKELINDRMGVGRSIHYINLFFVDHISHDGSHAVLDQDSGRYRGKGRYNSEWDGSYNIEVEPGEHNIYGWPIRLVSYSFTLEKPINLWFNAEPGHRYFLGDTRIINSGCCGPFGPGGDKVVFIPVIIDMTMNQFIYPPPSVEIDKNPFQQ